MHPNTKNCEHLKYRNKQYETQVQLLSLVVEITNAMHRFAPLLYSICWLLHVSEVVCHHQELLDLSELHENTDRFGGISYNAVKWHVCTHVT
jgi:hypothetical protein